MKLTKFTFSRLSSFVNAPATLNGIITQIETALDTLVSRDGAHPNQMNSALDMNSNRILNLPTPGSATEPLRLKDVTQTINGIQIDDAVVAQLLTLRTGSISTLPTGSPATVQITGTPPNQTLSFGLPKGDTGDRGETGPIGPVGATGPVGPKGDPWSYLPAAGGSVKAANAAALPSFTYASNVMTASANGAFPAIDGVTLSVGDRFWHWDYTGANGTNLAYGIYTLTDAGSAGTKWTATRATDADVASELGYISAYVQGGSANVGLVLGITQAAGAITVGTTPLCVTVASGNASAVAAVASEAALRSAADTALTNQIVGLPELVMTAGSSTVVQKFVEASGAVTPLCYQAISWVSGQTYTIQVIVKAVERKTVNLVCNIGAVFDCVYQLDNVLCSGPGASITSLGNGFFLCKVTVTASATTVGNFQIRIGDGNSYTGDGTSGLYVVSAQILVSGSDILVSGTDFSTGLWSKISVSVTPNVKLSQATAGSLIETLNTAVFGTLTGDKLTEASGASVYPAVYQAVSWVNSAVYTIKVEAKAKERSRINLFSNAGALFDCTFDLKFGVASGAGASITDLGNGWFRCTVSVTASGTTASNLQIRVYPDVGAQPYVGDGTSGLYVNSAFVYDVGGNVKNAKPTTFTDSAWSKQNVSVSADQAIFGGIPISTVSHPLLGFEHVGLGTSLTTQGKFTTVITQTLGTSFTNAGVAGASLGAASNGHYGSLGIYNAIATISTTAKIVTVECCTNDFAEALVPVGTRGDSTTATFYGALRAAIVAIAARAPNAAIFFISDHGAGSNTATHSAFATNASGATLKQYWQAMEDVCADMGVWLIDAGRKAGIGYVNANSLTSDGLHFNDTGGKIFGSYCVNELLRAFASGYIR